jgi:hypothetical protein
VLNGFYCLFHIQQRRLGVTTCGIQAFVAGQRRYFLQAYASIHQVLEKGMSQLMRGYPLFPQGYQTTAYLYEEIFWPNACSKLEITSLDSASDKDILDTQARSNHLFLNMVSYIECR